jgi:4-hydroxyacetophenone monooxygenase
MQIVPAIAGAVERLTVFQRTAQWVAPVPTLGQPIAASERWRVEHVPFYREWVCFGLWWMYSDRLFPSLHVDPGWPQVDSINAVNDRHRRFLLEYMQSELAGHQELLERTVPTYPPYGKRMLLDNGWFGALRRSNVELVAQPITRVTRDGVATPTGEEYPADVIAFCTGFDAQRYLQHLDIRGRDGAVLKQEWDDDDARAYLGITAPRFPNLFLIYGPNTNGSGGSFHGLAEMQVGYIEQVLTMMADHDLAAVEVRADRHDEYNRVVDERNAAMIWTNKNLTTYYRNSRGRVVVNMPWSVLDYWQLTRSVNADDFTVTPAAR